MDLGQKRADAQSNHYVFYQPLRQLSRIDRQDAELITVIASYEWSYSIGYGFPEKLGLSCLEEATVPAKLC